ncbi:MULTISPECIES: spore germination protein [Anoxybacillus]|uniref:Spore germination protein PF n=2 Tax=Anoxybacillus TaxID=150247 RepID=A0A7W8JER2_9BACL|nr:MULTISPECIES: spore germination protein [Anoxybacillus]MBA2877526.1 spore germination protein PF [Anoxybacillus ayderensis]MBB5354354.1 spore germination protein PF [Anoxybacillus mongoliensis]MCX8001003.1 spore germination protein [Anoxybacillus mongoliensis]MED0657160.1 spore germination protein [Anoxybacillus ayderensis]OSX54933.1 spore germination protein [Anoxybacillus ayderensis]
MPALVGPIKINLVASGAVMQVGDTLYVSPKISSKTFAGAGAFNTGNFIIANNGISLTNTLDSDVFDQNVAGNA